MTSSTVAGLDGCKAGWFVVVAVPKQDQFDCFVAASIADAWERLSDSAAVGIDIPIGIPDSGTRSCDRLARKLLSPWRTSSVFPAPIRPVLGATSYRKASEIRESIDGKRMSAQAFHILGKIVEVDRFMRSTAPARKRVYEVHPELAFAALNDGKPLEQPKRQADGFDRRFSLLAEHVATGRLDEALGAFPRKHVARDDVLDAFAVMLAARRIADGRGQRVPEDPVRDRAGLDMAIWF